jgi:hypothetical protein
MNIRMDVDSDEHNRIQAGTTSVWNLRTGERVERFSDLFYEGEDFLPAVKKALSRNSENLTLDAEPKDFSTATLTVNTRAVNSGFMGLTPDRYAVNELSEAWDFMPAWEFYDMTELFAKPGYVSIETVAPWVTYTKRYEDLDESFVDYSRFFSEDEIAALNADLTKIYDVMTASDEYKNNDYVGKYGDPVSYTDIDIDDSGRLSVLTPFGLYVLDRDTGELKTPATDPRLSDTQIRGAVDIDLDGETEYYREDDYGFTILDNRMKEIGSVSFGKYFNKLTSWQVTRAGGEFSGRIIADGLMVLDYHLEGREIITDGCLTMLTLDGKYYETPDSFGKLPQEKGPPVMELPPGATSVIYTASTLRGAFAYEMDFTDADKTAAKILSMKKSGKPFLLAAGETFTEIFPDETSEYIIRLFEDVIITGKKSPLGGETTFAVYHDGRVSYPFGEKGICAKFANSEELAFTVRATDKFTVNGAAFGETEKDYRFYIENGELFEHGSIKLRESLFEKNVIDLDTEIAKIKAEGEITSIFYHPVGYLIVNYTAQKNKTIIENRYTIFKMDIAAEWLYTQVVKRGKGHYLPSFSDSVGEDIAVYPAF